jgi:GTP-binding protein
MEIVIADLPGLIEGAHEGRGLGHRFLGHVERCGALLHLVDATGEDAGKAWKTVRKEIKAYGNKLDKKPEIVALSKADAVSAKDLAAQKAKLKRASKKEPLVLSAHTGKGVKEVLRALFKLVETKKERVLSKKSKEGTRAWRP